LSLGRVAGASDVDRRIVLLFRRRLVSILSVMVDRPTPCGRIGGRGVTDCRRRNPQLLGDLLDLAPKIDQLQGTDLSIDAAERYAIAEDVVGRNLLLSAGGAEDASLFRETAATLHVELVLVAERAHEPATGTRDLRRVERQALILRDT
jgi:hypothetical protein